MLDMHAHTSRTLLHQATLVLHFHLTALADQSWHPTQQSQMPLQGLQVHLQSGALAQLAELPYEPCRH